MISARSFRLHSGILRPISRRRTVDLGGDSIRLTDHGYMMADEIAARLMI